MSMKYLAYYFPGWHATEHSDAWHGVGWSEWDLLRAAVPRFDGHRQPRTSEWGEFDESSPRWARQQAELAVDHGLSGFLFDWYWYDGAPYMNAPLEDGFLVDLPEGFEFALMWANHDWQNMHPAAAVNPPSTWFEGRVDPVSFRAMYTYMTDRYFAHPSYLRVDGALYLSIYDIGSLVASFGSEAAAREALDEMRNHVRASGHGELHLNMIVADRPVLPGESTVGGRASTAAALGFDSVGSYVWAHHHDPATDGFPLGDLAKAGAAAPEAWRAYREEFSVPYYPNVTVGWDPSPRTIQTDRYELRDYPWTAIWENDDAVVETAMKAAIKFCASSAAADAVVTINAWNEWTEGSYLLPDTHRGLADLRAIQRAVESSA